MEFSKQSRIHFLHIGKTGGSNLKASLAEQALKGKYTIFLHNHGIRLNDIPRGEKVFFFLRNPLTRFVSGFYSRQRRGRPRYDYAWSELEEFAFGNFRTPNQLAEALTATNETIQNNAVMAMGGIQHVKSSFYDHFLSDSYFEERKDDILFIGYQESFESDVKRLETILELPKKLTLFTDDVNAHKNPEHLDKNLSETAINNLMKWYKKDISFFEKTKRINL